MRNHPFFAWWSLYGKMIQCIGLSSVINLTFMGLKYFEIGVHNIHTKAVNFTLKHIQPCLTSVCRRTPHTRLWPQHIFSYYFDAWGNQHFTNEYFSQNYVNIYGHFYINKGKWNLNPILTRKNVTSTQWIFQYGDKYGATFVIILHFEGILIAIRDNSSMYGVKAFKNVI